MCLNSLLDYDKQFFNIILKTNIYTDGK